MRYGSGFGLVYMGTIAIAIPFKKRQKTFADRVCVCVCVCHTWYYYYIKTYIYKYSMVGMVGQRF